ncbi:MAG: DUF3034 family protein [Armatimonadetes bacterium]|nr:DUF3034 family protein [Armatimonadota bacterium]
MHIKISHRLVTVAALAVSAALILPAPGAHAALNWEGQNGVFLNALAYPLGANKTEVAYHYVSLDQVGAVHSASVTHGLGGKADIGYTRVFVDVPGLKDQNIVHAKYQFVAETKNSPAVAVWVLHRDLDGSKSDQEYGIVATKVFSDVKDHPIILSAGVRSTPSLGQGVYGLGSHKVRFEGLVAIFVTKNLIVGTEVRQQVGSKTWSDLAARYVVNKNLNLDIGLANLGQGFRNQLALGATWAF